MILSVLRGIAQATQAVAEVYQEGLRDGDSAGFPRCYACHRPAQPGSRYCLALSKVRSTASKPDRMH